MIELKCKINVSVKKPKPKNEKVDEAPVVKSRGKVPRISRLMALAIRMDEMLRRGEAQDTFELAELGKVSQPRVTQILGLSLLAPEIQEALLSLPRETSGKPAIHERNLRAITREPMWDQQRQMWSELLCSMVKDSNGAKSITHNAHDTTMVAKYLDGVADNLISRADNPN